MGVDCEPITADESNISGVWRSFGKLNIDR
jgi:hypothetical protein